MDILSHMLKQDTSVAKSQSVRFHDTTVQIQTVVINGVECLRFEDLTRCFPSVSTLRVDNIVLYGIFVMKMATI